MLFALAVAASAVVLLAVWAINHTFSMGHSGGSVTLSNQVTVSGTVAEEANFTVAASTTNQQEALSFTQAGLQGIYVISDQDLTLKTNSTGSPQETIALKANVPFLWFVNGGIANPFAGNVTTTYWTNAGASAATVYVRTLVS